MNRDLCLNKDIAFGLADENVNESFSTFSMYSCGERECVYRISGRLVGYTLYRTGNEYVLSEVFDQKCMKPESHLPSITIKAISQETEILPTCSYQKICVWQIHLRIKLIDKNINSTQV